ncbi:recombination regulator RecX [Kangiella sp. HZ709]|uniref:recombination regulator RecX n=1 Tax=Kangiella sp. HZ709 TaxID=2666328 RepID=UPI0012AF0192|nr:recombination regulator RecX [Kangiella sp. HZ709]MRX26928.1 recombination regulator RecX [Kangiella sp. HZ709]
MAFKRPPRDHKHIAMDLLARREHSRRELINKLKIRGFEGEEVEAYLDRLAENGLQSDQRFAESYVRMRSGSGYGQRRISQELQQKGIAESKISQIYEELELDWYQIALEIWQKKYNQLPGSDLKLKAKQSRFLQYRGFDFDIINWIFSQNREDLY